MPSEKEAVLEALNALGAAFGRRDAAAFEDTCTNDFLFIGSTEGEEVSGRGDGTKAMFDAIACRSEGARFKLEWESVDVNVEGDLAFLAALGTATFETKYRTTSSRYRLTGILERSGEKWLWRVHHGSEPAPW